MAELEMVMSVAIDEADRARFDRLAAMMEKTMKPGWRTSEFWIAVAMQLITVLTIAGVIAPGDRESIQGAVVNAIAAIGTLASSAVILWRYIAARQAVKQAALLVQEPSKAAGGLGDG